MVLLQLRAYRLSASGGEIFESPTAVRQPIELLALAMPQSV